MGFEFWIGREGNRYLIDIETAPYGLNKEIRNIRKREETGAISFLLS